MKPTKNTTFAESVDVYVESIDKIVTFEVELDFEPEQIGDLETEPIDEQLYCTHVGWKSSKYTASDNGEIEDMANFAVMMASARVKEQFENEEN